MVILPSIRRKYMVSRLPKGATVPMSECVVTLAGDRAAYTGQARTVGVTVTWEGSTLEVNVDYTLSYANNVNIGPATVTVTGMGQFSGSVTKTFHIVMGSSIPWDFNITNAQRVGNKYVANMNGGRFRQFLDTHPSGGGILIGAVFANAQWAKGWVLPRDQSGELHIENIDTSDVAILDGSGASGSYYYLIGASPDGKNTYWGGSGSGYYIKQKSGSAFDFSNMTESGTSPSLPLVSSQGMLYNRHLSFANGGRLLFVADGGWTLRKFPLGTPYDVTTIDVDSVSVYEQILGFTGYNAVTAVAFDSTGTVALLSISERKYLYQAFLPTPFDFTNATLLGTLNMSSDNDYYVFSSLHVVNDGQTLIGCTSSGVSEFSLSPSSS